MEIRYTPEVAKREFDVNLKDSVAFDIPGETLKNPETVKKVLEAAGDVQKNRREFEQARADRVAAGTLENIERDTSAEFALNFSRGDLFGEVTKLGGEILKV